MKRNRKAISIAVGGVLSVFLICCSMISTVSLVRADGARTVQYGDTDIIPIHAKLRFSTLIVLPADEEILDATTGDKEFWIINGSHNLCYLHPAQQNIRSNLNLITASGHVYSFLLSEISKDPKADPDLKVFVERKEVSSDHPAVVPDKRGVLLWPELGCDAGADSAVTQVLADRLTRDGRQALRRCRSHSPSRRQVEPSELFPDGRAEELDRAVGRLLLVTVAEVRLEDATLRRHRLREACDPHMRVPSETTASVASPTDETEQPWPRPLPARARRLVFVHPGRDRRARVGASSVYESDSAEVLAVRRESGDPQAPS